MLLYGVGRTVQWGTAFYKLHEVDVLEHLCYHVERGARNPTTPPRPLRKHMACRMLLLYSTLRCFRSRPLSRQFSRSLPLPPSSAN